LSSHHGTPKFVPSRPAPSPCTLGVACARPFRSFYGESLEDRRLLALVTTDLNSGLTPTDLAQVLVGTGVTVQYVTFTGSNMAGAPAV
jgi:hypothetical protein